MGKKLTTSQVSALGCLKDGDRIYRHWGKLTGNWIVVGDWGKTVVSNATVQSLIKAHLVTVTDRIADWKYLALTDLGRAALRQPDAGESERAK